MVESFAPHNGCFEACCLRSKIRSGFISQATVRLKCRQRIFRHRQFAAVGKNIPFHRKAQPPRFAGEQFCNVAARWNLQWNFGQWQKHRFFITVMENGVMVGARYTRCGQVVLLENGQMPGLHSKAKQGFESERNVRESRIDGLLWASLHAPTTWCTIPSFTL